MIQNPPNILLVVLDTVRASNCSTYGYIRETTPVLDQIANEGVCFEKAITPAPWTLPSHASLFTGQFSSVHQVDGQRYHLNGDHKLLPEILQSEGFNTVGISSNVWISDTFGFDRGFDFFYKTWQLFQKETITANIVKLDAQADNTLKKIWAVLHTGRLRTIVNAFYAKYRALWNDDGSKKVSQKAIDWLRKRDKENPFFMFLNYLDPHTPYLPPKSHQHKFTNTDLSQRSIKKLANLSRRSKQYHMGQLQISSEEFEQMRGLYDEEISYTDTQLGQVISYLRREKSLDDTFVIVVGDHGENIGDHQRMAHRFSLHQTLLHVPFVVRYPHAFPKGVRDAAYVQLTDIMPTILQAIGRKELSQVFNLPGKSLLGNDYKNSRPILAEYLSTSYTAEARSEHFDFTNSKYNRTMRAYFNDNFKLVESLVDDSHELYDLARDPDEQNNLAEKQPEKLTYMREALHSYIVEILNANESLELEALNVNKEIKERLIALGYLG